ncbi:MAG: secondary thiamine-phosphate synthase enzyme YjbQ [Desulfobacteraceae bacterium]|nr:secondary thiamine-phosphate synthase enzyme YjbQ [Desulfobacteraceae bacterium]
MHTGTISVNSVKRLEFIDVTSQLGQEIAGLGQPSGVCYLYNPHTTAGVTINEGADPAVQEDLLAIFKRLAPESSAYRHQEGNSPAHALTSLVGSSAVVFVDRGALRLGVWQRIFFCEFDGPRSRQLHWRLL